jgi:hypothetical protein
MVKQDLFGMSRHTLGQGISAIGLILVCIGALGSWWVLPYSRTLEVHAKTPVYDWRWSPFVLTWLLSFPLGLTCIAVGCSLIYYPPRNPSRANILYVTFAAIYVLSMLFPTWLERTAASTPLFGISSLALCALAVMTVFQWARSLDIFEHRTAAGDTESSMSDHLQMLGYLCFAAASQYVCAMSITPAWVTAPEAITKIETQGWQLRCVKTFMLLGWLCSFIGWRARASFAEGFQTALAARAQKKDDIRIVEREPIASKGKAA